MSQEFHHVIGYLTISDFLKQTPPRSVALSTSTFSRRGTQTQNILLRAALAWGHWLIINGNALINYLEDEEKT